MTEKKGKTEKRGKTEKSGITETARKTETLKMSKRSWIGVNDMGAIRIHGSFGLAILHRHTHMACAYW